MKDENETPHAPVPPPQHATFAAALAAAQATMTNPVRDKENPHFKSRYTSLAAVRDAVVPALAAHGIGTVLEPRTLDDGRLAVFCHLLWGAETYSYGPVVFGVDQCNPQVAGSAATYGERYLLSAVGAVAADDNDDDGNAAADAARSAPASRPSAPNGAYGRASGQERPGSTQPADPDPTVALATDSQQRAVFAALNRMEKAGALDDVAFIAESGRRVTWQALGSACHDEARDGRQIPASLARQVLDAVNRREGWISLDANERPVSGVQLGPKGKKKAIEDMDVSSLEWWEQKIASSLDDPYYGAKNASDLAAVRAELVYRASAVEPNNGSEPEAEPDPPGGFDSSDEYLNKNEIPF